MWRWWITIMEVNYNEAYWDAVALQEWYLRVLAELTDD